MDDPAIKALNEFIQSNSVQFEKGTRSPRLPKPPQVEFDSSKTYYWNLDTSCGALKVKLLNDVAPMHVSSTIYLTLLGFYSGLNFHRVISGFMAQGGCPSGSGTGGPGYQYDGEYSSKARHDRPGLLSMANAGPGTDGSQFFLTFVPTDWLDDKHSIFGEVMDGAEVLQTMEKLGSRSGTPVEPISLVEATITVE